MRCVFCGGRTVKSSTGVRECASCWSYVHVYFEGPGSERLYRQQRIGEHRDLWCPDGCLMVGESKEVGG